MFSTWHIMKDKKWYNITQVYKNNEIIYYVDGKETGRVKNAYK